MAFVDSVKIITIPHEDRYADAETQTPKSSIVQLKQKMSGQIPTKYLHIPVHRRKRSRQCVREVARVEQRCKKLNEFIGSVEDQIKRKWGCSLTHAQLLDIAKQMSKEFDIPIDRDATRRKRGLLAWCAEHILEFSQFISTLKIENSKPQSETAMRNHESLVDLNAQCFDDFDMFTMELLKKDIEE